MKKITISNDPNMYEAWPDVAIAPSGELICVFSECTHHNDRSYTRIMLTISSNRGLSWTPKRALTEGTGNKDYYYNSSRISVLRDSRMAVIVDKIPRISKKGLQEQYVTELAENIIFFSEDSGKSWSEPMRTPLNGIVPDRLLELDNGRWIISAHHQVEGELVQFMHYSDDQGGSWSNKIVVAQKKGFDLCEVSILPVGNDTLVAFLRENSFNGYDCMKTISYDNGESWSDKVTNFPLPGCHRPVARYLDDGKIFITFRLLHGGIRNLNTGCQNFFGAVTDTESAIAEERSKSWARLFPIDYDRSPNADLGYSGHVQFDNGDIYIVHYIVDDAYDKGQIRGYALRIDDFLISNK